MTKLDDASAKAGANRSSSDGVPLPRSARRWLSTGTCLLAAVAAMPTQASLLLANLFTQRYVLIDSSPTRAMYVRSSGWSDIAGQRGGSVLMLYRSARIDPLRRVFWSRSYSVNVNCRTGVINARDVQQGYLDGMYDGMQLKAATDIDELDDPSLREAVCGKDNVDGYIVVDPEPTSSFGTLKGLMPGIPVEQIPAELLRSCRTVPRGTRTGYQEYVGDHSDCIAEAPFNGSASAFGSLGGVAIKSVRIALCDRKLVNVVFYTAPYPVTTMASPGPKHQFLRPLLEGGFAPTSLTLDNGSPHATLFRASWRFSDWSFNVGNGNEGSTAAFQASPFERETAISDLLAGRATRQSPWSCTRVVEAKSDFR